MYGGTVSRCVDSVTRGAWIDVAKMSSRPGVTGIRVVVQPRLASNRSTNAMTSPSCPLVESIRMRSSATSTTSGGVCMGCKASPAEAPRANQPPGLCRRRPRDGDPDHTVRQSVTARRSRAMRRDAEAGGAVLGPCLIRPPFGPCPQPRSHDRGSAASIGAATRARPAAHVRYLALTSPLARRRRLHALSSQAAAVRSRSSPELLRGSLMSTGMGSSSAPSHRRSASPDFSSRRW